MSDIVSPRPFDGRTLAGAGFVTGQVLHVNGGDGLF
jgi:hypothetical protein